MPTLKPQLCNLCEHTHQLNLYSEYKCCWQFFKAAYIHAVHDLLSNQTSSFWSFDVLVDGAHRHIARLVCLRCGATAAPEVQHQCQETQSHEEKLWS